MLHLKPFKPHDNIFDGHQVLTTALDAHRRIYPTRNMPGIVRHSRQIQPASSAVKFKVGCCLLKTTLIAFYLILLGGDISRNPGPGYRNMDEIRKARGLKIAHLNIRSLRHKIDPLRLEGFNTKTFDVLTLSETWLYHSVEDSEIALPGFTCVQKDRTEINKGYGGVVIYVREGLPFQVRSDLHSSEHECLWIEIIRPKCRSTLICCAYRAPNIDFTDFISNFNNCMENIKLDKCDLVCLGDLNVNLLSHSRNKEKKDLLKFMNVFDLTQLITDATRVTETTRTLLDVILVNNDHRITDSGVVFVPLSDHYLVYCVLKSGITKAQPKTIEYRSYKNFDVNSFVADLNNVPWHIIENEEDINDAVFSWNTLFTEVADLHAPVKRCRVKGAPIPWMNNKINELMKDRDFHHHKAVKTNSDHHWARYRSLRNLVNREIKSAKSNYYCNLINDAKGDSGKVWKAVNEASSRNVISLSPQCIVTEGVQLTTPSLIAAAMNSHFASIGKTLVDKNILCSFYCITYLYYVIVTTGTPLI